MSNLHHAVILQPPHSRLHRVTQLNDVFPLVYDELRRLAAQHLARERPEHTLQPTELVHEAYMRLVGQRTVDWNDRAQFFGTASQMMRRILVNHAIAVNTDKRGGGQRPITLSAACDAADPSNDPAPDVDVIALDAALNELAQFDARGARVVELRFFGGLAIDETADVLGVSTATIKREWAAARLWLRRAMRDA